MAANTPQPATVESDAEARDTLARFLKYRTSLPLPMFSRQDFSIWSILKQCIGKELSKITMPVIFNEPLSFLQRISEYMEYAKLLETASLCDDPLERMQYVCAFAVSAISSNWERIGKPFNPLLGETYELDRPDLGFRLISEQVSHHPPISAFHVESEHFRFHGSIHPKLKFWGKSVEVNPKGIITLELLKHGEIYTWQNVNCCVHNVIVGKLWVEHYGIMEVTNHKTKHKGIMNFKQSGWFGKDLHRIDGYIYDQDKRKLKALYGNWVLGMFSVDLTIYEAYLNTPRFDSPRHTPKSKENGTPKKDLFSKDFFSSKGDNSDDIPKTSSQYDLQLSGQQSLWKADKRPETSNLYFSFTAFAITLNEAKDHFRDLLPPSDSRLRPDIQKLEEGQIDPAAAEKNRLEEKQRAVRKERKKRRDVWVPRWFQLCVNQTTGKEDWRFTEKYWNRNWSQCPNIF